MGPAAAMKSWSTGSMATNNNERKHKEHKQQGGNATTLQDAHATFHTGEGLHITGS